MSSDWSSSSERSKSDEQAQMRRHSALLVKNSSIEPQKRRLCSWKRRELETLPKTIESVAIGTRDSVAYAVQLTGERQCQKTLNNLISIGLSVRFFDRVEENIYYNRLQSNYKYLAPVIGFYYTLFLIVIGSVLLVIATRIGSRRLLISWCVCFSLVFGLASLMMRCVKYKRKINFELLLYITLLVSPCTASFMPELQLFEGTAYEGAVEMASIEWTIEWCAIAISLILLDIYSCCRTMTAIWVHAFINITIVASKLTWLYRWSKQEEGSRFVDLNRFGAPRARADIWIAVFQCFQLIAFLWQMYAARYLAELQLRSTFISQRYNLGLLELMKEREKHEQQSRAAEKNLSLTERILLNMRRARTQLMTLAFEEEERGDPYLLELHEQINTCMTLISANANSLFKVVASSGVNEETSNKQLLLLAEPLAAAPLTPAQEAIDKEVVLEDEPEYPALEAVSSPKFLAAVGKELNISCLELYLTRPNLLLEVGFHQLSKVIANMSIPVADSTLLRYVYLVQARHWNNPYHNIGHVALVLHMAQIFEDAFQFEPSPVVSFALQLAALGHDLGHGGRTSQFILTDGIQRSDNLLVNLCGTENVIETLHAHLTFRIAQIKGSNIFAQFPDETYRKVRRYVIDLILATDMAEHFNILGALRVRHDTQPPNWWHSPNDQLFMRKLILKCADLAHVCVSWSEHFDWSSRIAEEFFIQGDLERELKYTITPQCDRKETKSWSKSQHRYISEVVMPFYVELGKISHTQLFDKACEIMKENKDRWLSPHTLAPVKESSAAYRYEESLLWASLMEPSLLLLPNAQTLERFLNWGNESSEELSDEATEEEEAESGVDEEESSGGPSSGGNEEAGGDDSVVGIYGSDEAAA